MAGSRKGRGLIMKRIVIEMNDTGKIEYHVNGFANHEIEGIVSEFVRKVDYEIDKCFSKNELSNDKTTP
jgi:hypothetical protein